MSIASMTGFAREAGVTGSYQWAWELKTVNGRGLEVRVRTPSGLDTIGEEARGLILKALTRGQGQLNLALGKATSAPKLRVNQDVLQSLLSAIGGLSLPDNVQPASLDGLLSVRGVVELDDDAADPLQDEDLVAALRAGIGALIESLKAVRLKEGQALAAVLGQQLDIISRLVDEAEAAPARQPDAIRARLEAQIAELLDGKTSLDPARLHQEAVLIAARADIREELDRLRAHVDAARGLLQEGGSVGRRLDFLAQEFGREANTLCAKANDVSLSRIGLELKAVIEQFREQVQNVE
ncbi:YicC/YloC family endoribonuclease [Microvirga lotononidis]|uniref:TIGR00255 family protein n=1 Tax=Microvirga lotononidis TaxID=864069 RepID=I4YWH6_9HYPH|nr:YicC/YloC family endoribonuclease [Microvirga lotononidis]EIM28318.1 TIGR00255 family protein [Microvirga lotononidis]WQO27590.1 YicC/YloC family endoribonuclease [Microvirga lotononidis]